MLNRFEFATAARIIFGAGTLREIGPLAGEIGGRSLVVCTGPDRVTALLDRLHEAQIATDLFTFSGEPKIETAQAGAEAARRFRADLVIGMGGGAVLDAAKAIAALATNPGDPLDYLEVIGRAGPLKAPPLPVIAIPTTAGTGSEVTRNGVLTSDTHKVKVSLRSPLMLPRIALVDPELTYSLPPALTASTGLDALTQVMEPFVCNRTNPLTDAICRDGMSRAARSLARAYHEGSDPAARADMALCSLFGGLALANARLGAVHGFAAPIGGMFPAPHGAVCAILLPRVMRANLTALREREDAGDAGGSAARETLARYTEVARLLTGDPAADADQGAAWVESLVKELQIPGLSHYGITAADFPTLVEKAAVASSMQGNPVKLTPDALKGILAASL